MDNHQPINGNGKHAVETEDRSLLQVDVFRVKEGEAHFIRTLAANYGGLFTHYYQKRSRVCRGADCYPVMHRSERVWKGYTPVLVFLVKQRIWVPKVLEITAHLELDFRDIFTRAQEWEIFRHAPLAGKTQPVIGKLHNAHVASRLPVAFDVEAVVKNLYGVECVDLANPNPMPRRTFVEVVEGDVPGALADKIAMEDEDKRRYEARQKAVQDRRQSPNGQK